MSATLDAAPVARYLGDCPVVEVPGAAHPLAVEYAPAEPVSDAVRTCCRARAGQVLCFLPGRREIEAAAADLDARLPRSTASRSCRCTAASTATPRTGRCARRRPAGGA